MKYYIYKITNTINGKGYVGKTKEPKKRFGDHCWANIRIKSLINRAIQKYGKENFTFEIIDQIDYTGPDDEGKTSILESFYISKYNTLVPNGYNLMFFSDSRLTVHPDTRKKQGKSAQRKGTANSLGFKGIRKARVGNNFTCSVRINTKIVVRTFPSVEAAAEAYDRIVLFLYGKDAALNYPRKLEVYLNQDLASFFNLFIEKPQFTSKYRGVGFVKTRNKWRARMEIVLGDARKNVSLGWYDTDVKAAEMIDKFTIYLNLRKKLNFPEKIHQYLESGFDDVIKFLNREKTSKYIGVCREGSKWRGYFFDGNHKYIHVGTFDSEEEAFQKRTEAKEKYLTSLKFEL